MKKIDYILVNKPHLIVINDCRVYFSGKKVGICDNCQHGRQYGCPFAN